MKMILEWMVMLRYSLRCAAVRRAAMTAAASAAISITIAIAWWGPAKQEQARLQGAVDAIRIANAENARMASAVQAEHEALQSVALLEKKLAMPASQAELIQGVDRLAARRGVRVVAQSFDEGKAQHKDGALYMELGLVGNYGSLRGLMGDLASLPMWVEVVEVRFDRGGDDGAPLRAQLRLLTYREARTPS